MPIHVVQAAVWQLKIEVNPDVNPDANLDAKKDVNLSVLKIDIGIMQQIILIVIMYHLNVIVFE
jgi:hypothetical protein